MTVIRIPFRSLTIWALVVLKETADCAGAEPVVATPELRLALAWLAAVRPKERTALNLFWQDATQVLSIENDHRKAYFRGLGLLQRVSGLAERMSIGGELLSDTHRRWKQGLFDGPGEAECHAYLKERIAAYREEEKRRAALY